MCDNKDRFLPKPSPSELDRAGVSQTHLLQQGRERRALCGVGTAAALLRRGVAEVRLDVVRVRPLSDQEVNGRDLTGSCLRSHL